MELTNKEPNDVRFEGYESYVDSAVAQLRGTFLTESQRFIDKARNADTALYGELAGIQNGLVGTVDEFLNTTITITAADASALRARAEGVRQSTLEVLASAREAAVAETEASLAGMLEAVAARFDRELEGHQGRMTKRFVEAKDTLGSVMVDLRRAKEKELRDK